MRAWRVAIDVFLRAVRDRVLYNLIFLALLFRSLAHRSGGVGDADASSGAGESN